MKAINTLLTGILLTCASQVQAQLMTFQPGSEGKDAQIVDINPDLNLGDYEDLISFWGSGTRSIGLLEFDLSSIPTDFTIVSAELSIYHSANGTYGHTYDVFRVTSPWEEDSVTYNTAPTYDPAAVASFTMPTDYWSFDLYRQWDVTSIVQDWYTGAHANYGLWIEEVPVSGGGIAVFSSSDDEAGYRPMLQVQVEPIPEPGTIGLMAVAGLGLVVGVRRLRTQR